MSTLRDHNFSVDFQVGKENLKDRVVKKIRREKKMKKKKKSNRKIERKISDWINFCGVGCSDFSADSKLLQLKSHSLKKNLSLLFLNLSQPSNRILHFFEGFKKGKGIFENEVKSNLTD